MATELIVNQTVGGNVDFGPYSIETIDIGDLKVTLDGELQTLTTEYTVDEATSTVTFVTAPDVGQVVRIFRETPVDAAKAVLSPGSSIRAQNLNDNTEQALFAIQEIKDQYVTKSSGEFVTNIDLNDHRITNLADPVDQQDAVTKQYLEDNYFDDDTETILSSEAWPDNDTTIATTASIDNRIDSKIDSAITGDIGTDGTGITVTNDGDGTITLGLGAGSIDFDRIKDVDIITSAEAWNSSDAKMATTQAIDDYVDTAITNDIGVDSTGLTLTDDGDGTITLGIGANSVDLDRIKDGDIISLAEQDAGSPAPADTNIFTASAAAKRFDTLVQTDNPGLLGDWEVGKTWLQNDSNRALSIWSGSAWLTVSEGGGFVSQPNVVYVDTASGDDAATGHRISTPKETIAGALEQINSEIEIDVTHADFNGGSGYVNGSYTNVPLTGGTGTGLTASVTVSGGAVTAITLSAAQQTVLEDYSIGDVLSADNSDLGGSGSGLSIPVSGTGDGQVVVVASGVYQETAPLQIKRRNISIIGQALRSCIVHPTQATETNTLFELNSGSFISNLTLTGVKAGTGTGNTLDADLPTTQGWNFAFYDDAFIVKSPYIQNCTNFSDSEIDNTDLNAHNPAGGQAGDTDSDPTGGGLLVNGATPHDDSPLRSMVCDSYTHVGLNGPGILVVNNGYVQATSSYAFFNKYHIKCLSGGQANLAASTTDFGDQALVADGRSTNAIFTSTTFADAADLDTEFFINGPTPRTATPLPWHGSDTRPQSNMLVDIGGNTYPILSASNTFNADEIVSGRDYTILTVGDTNFTAIGAASNTVGVQFTATGTGTGSGTVTDDTGWRVTISRPNPTNKSENLGLDGAVTSGGAVSFFLRSQVASSGHTMEYVGSGTNYSALPENGGVPDETRQITELNNGKIWTAVTDHNGKFKIGGNQTDDPIFQVDQQTGFVTIPSGSVAFDLVSDLTPQLGGDLDVNGNTITGLSNPTANDEVANKAYVDSVAGTPTQIAQLNTSVQTSDTGTDGTITFTTDGTTAMTIDNNQNVGVGTAIPAETFEVQSASNTTIRIDNEDDSTAKLYFHNTGSTDMDISVSGASMTFNHGASERVRIDSDGRLLVGASSAPNTNTSAIFQLADSAGPRFILARNDTTTVADDDIGSIRFYNNDDDGNYDECARIAAEAEFNYSSTSKPTYLRFLTTASGDSSPTERLRIDSAGRLLIGGTSSISLNAIASALQIQGTGSADSSAALYRYQNNTNPPFLYFAKSRGTTVGAAGAVTNNDYLGEIRFNGDDGTDLNNLGASIEALVDGTPATGSMPGELRFSTNDGTVGTNPITRMTIRADGSIGIGTTGPNTTLHVKNESTTGFSAADNEDFSGIGILIESSTAGGDGNYGAALAWTKPGTDSFFKTAIAPVQEGADSDVQGLAFFTADGNIATDDPAERVRIDNSGRVLIGTTTSAVVGGTVGAGLQLDGVTTTRSRMSIVRRNIGATGPQLTFGKTGGSGDEAVADGDTIGRIEFAAGDGTDLQGVAARIECKAAADSATGDTPGRIRFATTPSGSNSPTVVGQFQPDGDFEFDSGYGSAAPAYGCRAWARVNGSATAVLVQDGGFTSFTDNGTGDFSFAFDNTFPDSNYAVVCSGSRNNGNANDALAWTAVHNLTSTGFDMTVTQTNSAFSATASLSDLATRIGVAVFR